MLQTPSYGNYFIQEQLIAYIYTYIKEEEEGMGDKEMEEKIFTADTFSKVWHFNIKV